MQEKRTSFKHLIFPLFFFILVAAFVQSQGAGVFKPGALTTDCTPCNAGDANNCEPNGKLITCVYDETSCPAPGYYQSTSSCPFGQVCGEGQCMYPIGSITECTDECGPINSKECIDVANGYRVCGNYDPDSCLDWSASSLFTCPENTVCSQGNCNSQTCPTQNWCNTEGQVQCKFNTNTIQKCTSNPACCQDGKCQAWTDTQTCPSGQTCGYGSCITLPSNL